LRAKEAQINKTYKCRKQTHNNKCTKTKDKHEKEKRYTQTKNKERKKREQIYQVT